LRFFLTEELGLALIRHEAGRLRLGEEAVLGLEFATVVNRGRILGGGVDGQLRLGVSQPLLTYGTIEWEKGGLEGEDLLGLLEEGEGEGAGMLEDGVVYYEGPVFPLRDQLATEEDDAVFVGQVVGDGLLEEVDGVDDLEAQVEGLQDDVVVLEEELGEVLAPLVEGEEADRLEGQGAGDLEVGVVLGDEGGAGEVFGEEGLALDVGLALVGGQDAGGGKEVALVGQRANLVLQADVLEHFEHDDERGVEEVVHLLAHARPHLL